MKKALCFAFALIISVQCCFAQPYDISEHWAKDTINYLIEKNVISGYSDNTIRPDNYITRAEFITVLNRLFDYKDYMNISFDDIDENAWYYREFAAAIKKGYISGYNDNTIRPENYLTRQEAAVIISRIMGYTTDETASYVFSDDIDLWARGFVGAAAVNNVINGYSDGTFRARNSLTRAEAFTMLKNAYDDNSDDIEVDYTQEFTLNENYSAVYMEFPDKITSANQWKNFIYDCVDNIIDSCTITIQNFDENVYLLSNLDRERLSEVSIVADGSVSGNEAVITYRFTYKENYKIYTAAKNGYFLTDLSDGERKTLTKIKSITQSVIKNDMTDYEKEKAIHDYIVENYSYADEDDDEQGYTLKGLIVNQKGYCEAYAYLFAVMSVYAGLDVGFVKGKLNGNDHLWNYICLDGENYHVDVTSDDPRNINVISYDYFNCDDSHMDGYEWSDVVCTGEKYNYFEYNSLVFNSAGTLAEHIQQGLEAKDRFIYFKTPIAVNSDFLKENNFGVYISEYSLHSNGASYILEPVYR